MPATELIISKQQSLLRATSLVSLMTFVSRITGFARDMIIAQLFGASAGMDAFIIAFKIPNFMRRLFAEGAFSQAFVPVLSEYQQTKSPEDVRTFLARVSGRLSAVLSIITVMGILLAPIVVWIFAPGFGENSLRSELATGMLRITFPYLMLISLTAMAGAALNTYGYFGIPAITPVLLNISMIVTAWYLSPHFSSPIVAVAYGVLIAGIVQFLFQLPFLLQKNLLVRPRFVLHDPGVKKVIKLMIPALFGVSIAQLNLMVDSIFASFLQVGSVSWLYFTDRLTDFPLGVFGVAIATVILPHLSRRHIDQNKDKYSSALDWAIRAILLIGIPAGVGLAVFSMPLIACCFAFGKFSAIDLLQTQKSLITLALGVPAFMLVKALASGFYACQDIKTPVKIGAYAMLINTIFCAIFIWPLAHAGLTLASALAGYINCACLLYILIKREIYTPKKGWFLFLMKLLFANLLIIIYLYWASGDLFSWLNLSFLPRVGHLLQHILVAVLIYFISLYILGIRLSEFRSLESR
jgi:putative peptidoglycan lipid II flippase